MFEADFIIDPRVIHERIDVVESRNGLLHNLPAVRSGRQIYGKETDLQALSAELIPQLLTRRRVPVYSDCDRTFLGAGFGDGRADAFCAARHQHNFIFELQIHRM